MDGGLGIYFISIAVVVCTVLFVAGFFIARTFFKRGILTAFLCAIALGVVGFFASPYLAVAYLHLRGISVL